MSEKHPTEVRALVDLLGRVDVTRECGITTQAVSQWVAFDAIPPKRYLSLKRLGDRKAVSIPEHLFRERGAA